MLRSKSSDEPLLGELGEFLKTSQGFWRNAAQDYRCEDFFPEATRFPPAADQSTTLPPDNVVTPLGVEQNRSTVGLKGT